MKRITAIMALALLAGCARKPLYIEYYVPVTPAEREAGHGAVRIEDYRKPHGAVTILGISLL